MKRFDFIKKLFTATAAMAVSPALLAKDFIKKEYSFDEIFEVWKGNNRLIYPKKETTLYSEITKSIINRIDDKATATYLPVHQLYIPVKDKYTLDELKPIKYYFENTYSERNKFSTQHGVAFRMIKDKPDRMYLEVFLNYSYK